MSLDHILIAVLLVAALLLLVFVFGRRSVARGVSALEVKAADDASFWVQRLLDDSSDDRTIAQALQTIAQANASKAARAAERSKVAALLQAPAPSAPAAPAALKPFSPPAA